MYWLRTGQLKLMHLFIYRNNRIDPQTGGKTLSHARISSIFPSRRFGFVVRAVENKNAINIPEKEKSNSDTFLDSEVSCVFDLAGLCWQCKCCSLFFPTNRPSGPPTQTHTQIQPPSSTDQKLYLNSGTTLPEKRCLSNN